MSQPRYPELTSCHYLRMGNLREVFESSSLLNQHKALRTLPLLQERKFARNPFPPLTDGANEAVTGHLDFRQADGI